LGNVYSLAFIENLMKIFSKSKQINPLSYKSIVPLEISMMQRISSYLLLTLSIVLALTMLLKILKRNVSLPQLTLTSAIIVSYGLSLYYSFLMSTIYIRYYIHFFLIAIPLVFSFRKVELRSLLYFLIAFIVVSKFVSTVYVASNSDRLLSQYTTYISRYEYENLCDFFENSAQSILFADIKTSFTLPIKCNNPNIATRNFKTEFFSYYNGTHNVFKTMENGIFLYTLNYMRNGIYVAGWKYYKPFIVQESDFKGIILNCGSMKLYIK